MLNSCACMIIIVCLGILSEANDRMRLVECAVATTLYSVVRFDAAVSNQATFFSHNKSFVSSEIQCFRVHSCQGWVYIWPWLRGSANGMNYCKCILVIIILLLQKRLTANIPRQRTISINLKKNKEHEFSDYVRTLRASPCIPFKADQAPKAPVLKPSPSPILVKGPLLRKKLQKKMAASASPQLCFKKRRQTAASFF